VLALRTFHTCYSVLQPLNAIRKSAMGNSDLKFHVLCKLFDSCAKPKAGKLRSKHLSTFREKCIDRTSEDVYEVYRLILPAVSLLSLSLPPRGSSGLTPVS
jgi:hypothetical protein